MSISITCPSCSKSLKAPESAAGKNAKCGQCGTRIPIPPLPPVRVPARSVMVSPPLTPQLVPSNVPCPFCAEAILPAAKKCKHCGEMLDPRLRAMEESQRAATAPVMKPTPQTVAHFVQQPTQTVVVNVHAPRWSRGMAILLSVLIPGLGQLYKGQPINAVVWFVLTVAGYLLIFPGLILHFLCIIGASMGNPNK